MKEIVFLLEEESAKAMLESLLPRILSPEIVPRLIAFEGKQDLEKQMVKRLKGYINPQARFIIIRDQDSNPDCRALKADLLSRCRIAGKEAVSLVRITCRELESIYLADLAAVGKSMTIRGLAAQQSTSKYRDPDQIGSPSQELARLTNGKYQKVSSSREIGKYLNVNNGRSPSFRNLVSGVRRMEQELVGLP